MAPHGCSTLETCGVSMVWGTTKVILLWVKLREGLFFTCYWSQMEIYLPSLGMLPFKVSHFEVFGTDRIFFHVRGWKFFRCPQLLFSYRKQNSDFLWVQQTSRNKKSAVSHYAMQYDIQINQTSEITQGRNKLPFRNVWAPKTRVKELHRQPPKQLLRKN